MAAVDLEAAETNIIIDFSGKFLQYVCFHTLSSPEGKQFGWRLREGLWKNFTVITAKTLAFILELIGSAFRTFYIHFSDGILSFL